MTTTPPPLGSWHGGEVGDSIRCVLADNPGPMTLDGTNTWLICGPGSHQALVIDPGPDDEHHLNAVLRAARERDAQVVGILLTHGHADHSAGARRFAELTGSQVRALDPGHRHGGEGLTDGEVIELDGLRLDVVTTPGHTADSLSFLLPDLRALLTGDTVLGRGTAVIAHPDGRLGEYLPSLARLRDLCAAGEVDLLLPGHGPVLEQPTEVLQGYLAHRQARLEQVRAALATGARTAPEVVAVVYADLDLEQNSVLRQAAELSVLAQLDYLQSLQT